MNDPNKRIDVNISSLLSLKAELLRKQEEVNRVKSTKSIENFVPTKIPKPENPGNSSSKSVVQNQENVSGPERSIEETDEDIAMLAKSKRVLEQKSKYYERMTKAGGSLNSDENCLVMFNKKMQDTKILDDSSDDSDSFDEGKEDYSSTNPEEDWVEYTDCFGRTRKCIRKDLEFMKRKDGNVSNNVGGAKPEEPEPPPTPWIIDTEGEKSKNDSGDDSSDELLKMGIKEQMKKDWERKERENVDKEFIHYQDVLFDGAKNIVVLQNVPAEVVECEDITNPNILECYVNEDYEDENINSTEPDSYFQQFDNSSSFEPISPAPIMNELELHSELIIEAVQSKPALWNIRDGGYKSRDIRARLWEEVVTESNFPATRDNVTRVRKHWETIKATYKRTKNRIPSGSKGGYQKPYKFAKLLSFLDDTNEPRRSIELGGDTGDTESTVDFNRVDDFEKIIPKKKKKLNYQGETHDLQRRYVEALERKLPVPPSTSVATPPTPDSIDMFLGSLKPYLESLSLTSRLKAQQKMMSSLIESLQEEEEKKKIEDTEARTHGVGYYQFSTDDLERERQREELDKMRDDTLDEQKKREEARKKREQIIAERVRAAKNRQRARQGLPPLEDVSLENKEEPLYDTTEEQERKEMEEQIKRTQEKEEKQRERTRKKYVRPWDKGKDDLKNTTNDDDGTDEDDDEWKYKPEKVPLSQQQCNEKKREERPKEFAPLYHSVQTQFSAPEQKQNSKSFFQRNKNIATPIEDDEYYVEEDESKSLFFTTKKQTKSHTTIPINDDESNETDERLPQGIEIPPPPTFEYYGPSSSKKARTEKPSREQLVSSIEAGLKFLREQSDKNASSGGKRVWTSKADY